MARVTMSRLSYRLLVFALFAVSFAACLSAQNDNPQTHTEGGLVTLGDERLFTVTSNEYFNNASERADTISRRLLGLANNPELEPAEIKVEDRGNLALVVAGGEVLFGISDKDATGTGKSRGQLADEEAALVRGALQHYRDYWSWKNVVRAGTKSLIVLVVFFAAVWLLFRLDRRLRSALARWLTHAAPVRVRVTKFFTVHRLLSVLFVVLTILRWVAFLFLLQTAVWAILEFFPGTRSYARTLSGLVWQPLGNAWNSFVDYLPSLFVVIVILTLARYAMQLTDFFFRELEAGRISISGFYPDWANPTSKLVRVLIVLLAAIIVYPYLPGSNSAAFKGVSIFVGVLLSIGSSSVIASGVAGTILTYMRPYTVGDRVKIDNTLGDVVERNLLITRLKTIHNVIVTIPNSAILSSQIENYSRVENAEGLILNTSVTIGYSAPWRQVEELLISAALATANIVHEPAPYVLQTALNDFFVTYQLNAFTRKSLLTHFTYAELHRNIQDKFNEAGVEIMSPHYEALRDGNHIAIPENYVAPKYEPPAFRVAGTEKVKGASAAES